jgi:DNA-binding LytR/AlgR family response regulator
MKIYSPKGNQSLLVINQKKSSKVLINNVVLLKGDINYTTFYLKNGNTKVVARTLKFFEAYLQTHGFLRIHRSYIINPNFIKECSESHDFLTMINGLKANISRRRKHTLKFS